MLAVIAADDLEELAVRMVEGTEGAAALPQAVALRR